MNPELVLRQEAAKTAEARMVEMLIGLDGAENLTVSDLKYIARWCRTCAFDAIREVDAKEGRA